MYLLFVGAAQQNIPNFTMYLLFVGAAQQIVTATVAGSGAYTPATAAVYHTANSSTMQQHYYTQPNGEICKNDYVGTYYKIPVYSIKYPLFRL